MGQGVRKGSPSYYDILGVSSHSSSAEIRRAYRKLAMRWHPDRWARTPSLSGEAKVKFQQIQEAYTVLSDRRKRTMYDSGLYNPEDEEDEGFSDFVEEMVSLMAEVRKENRVYSKEDLQAMLMEIAQGFESPTWYCSGPSIFDESPCSKKIRLETDKMNYGDGSYLQLF